MKSLQYGLVSMEGLSELGAVTMIHGGAGPISKSMERSQEGYLASLATLEALRIDAQKREANPVTPYLRAKTARVLSLAEAQTLQGVISLEASPAFNAGRGSALQVDGVCRVSAAAMESRRCRLSAVVNAQRVCHPSVLALCLQDLQHGVRDSEGAALLMRDLGIPLEDPVTPYQFEKWSQRRIAQLTGVVPTAGETGTVGSVSCDSEGQLSAMTSTGGIGFEAVGRVGDVPTIAGTYCTRRTAVSCTGYGEEIVSHAVAARLAVRLEDSSNPEFALEQTINEALAANLRYAFICVHKLARGVLWARGATTEHFAWGVMNSDGISFSNE
jgi:L-asparaginase